MMNRTPLQVSATATFVAALIMSLLVTLALSAPTAGASVRGADAPRSTLSSTQTSDRMWFWSQAYAEQALRRNGIRFSNAYDRVVGVRCAGLGKWIVSRGTAMFRDFHCSVDPQDRVVYKIVFHVIDQRTYRVTFSRYQQPVEWWWPAQYAADTLVRTGIRWSNGHDRILSSSCAAFGPSSRIQGSLYWAHFYCTVSPARGLPYAVVLDVTDRLNAHVSFVTFTNYLPATPAVTTPTPSSNTTNQQLVNRILNNQLSLQIVQQGIKHQNQIRWGNDTAPDGISIMLGAVGCKRDPFSTHAWKSWSAC